MNTNSQNQGQGGGGGMGNMIQEQQIRGLPFVPDAQKVKWIQNLANIRQAMQVSPQDSPQYKQAVTAWAQLTMTIKKDYVERKNAQQGEAAGASQGPRGPQGQPQQQGQQQQSQQGQQMQGQPQQNAGGPQGGQQRPTGPPRVPPEIINFVENFSYSYPPNAAEGTTQGAQWLQNTKKQVTQLLAVQHSNKGMLEKANIAFEQRRAQGQEIPQEMIAKRNEYQKQFNEAKAKMDKFKENQAKAKQLPQQNQQQSQQQQQQRQSQPQQQLPQQMQQQDGSQFSAGPGGAQNFQLRMPGNQNQQSPAQGQQQAGTNPAVEAARISNNTNRSSMSPVTSGQPQHIGQAQTSFSQPPQPGSQNMPQQQQQQSQNASQQPRPALNTQQPGGAAMNQMPHQNSPHNSQQQNPPSAVVPLSHQQAINRAERSYSDQRGTPQSTQQSYQQAGSREYQGPPKAHIPKNLPPNLLNTPAPVAFSAPRPTYTSQNGITGMVGQPAIQKPPAFQLEGGENGTGVLSKKKLDELVRQVTGGPDGMASEGLTPEVEEAMLMLADEFVDNVITAACRLAKLRESQVLDIRDIQLILERNYNIRVPGYASDEIRTIRKFHPTPGWTTKMNAVQASKVMGGKTDI